MKQITLTKIGAMSCLDQKKFLEKIIFVYLNSGILPFDKKINEY